MVVHLPDLSQNPQEMMPVRKKVEPRISLSEDQAGETINIEKGAILVISLPGCHRQKNINYVGSQDAYAWEKKEEPASGDGDAILNQVDDVLQFDSSTTQEDENWNVRAVSYQWMFDAVNEGDIVLTFQKYHYNDFRIRNLDGSQIKNLVGEVSFTIHVTQQTTSQEKA